MAKLLALVDARQVDAVIIPKLDRLTCSVKDLCSLLELFELTGEKSSHQNKWLLR
jgi:DNA invertase Pin-like site-specific DNA recombinase